MSSRKTYSRKLRNRRKELNMSTEFVAEKLNCSTAAILAYERGDRAPRLERMKAIAELYGMSIDELFFCKED